MKRLTILFAAALALALGAVFVIGAAQDAQNTAGATGQYTAPAPNNITAEGGNVTEANVSSDASTQKWQGFWGNISGSLQLGDGSSTFYDWSVVSFQAVYASPGNNVDWASVTSLNTTAQLESKDSDFSFSPGDDDSINQTMSGAACNAGTEISNAAGVTPYNSTGSAGSWTTCLGSDTTGGVDETVLGTNVVSGDAYNGNTVDYQLMAPVNGGSDLYYFYLEI